MTDLMKLAESIKPKKRNSILDPYLAELRVLKEKGYSLEQMRILLAELNVNVSRQTIYDFLKRREKVVTENKEASPQSITPKSNTKQKPQQSENKGESTDNNKPVKKSGMPFVKKVEIDLDEFMNPED
ncbi:MAG: hypothetical protein ACXV79_00715 [Methylobacter sp.]